MRVKTKGLLTAALFAVLFGLFAVLFMFAPKGATTASAATVYTPTYNLQFGYSLFNGRNLDDATHLVTAETDINETKELQVGDKAFRLKIRIWGSFPDGTTVNAEKGGYINSMTVNIEVSEGFANHYIKVSYAGRTDAFATRTIKKFTLVYPESEYEGVYEGYTTLSDGSVVKIIAKFRFCVDTHAPEIEGGSELENELYTNKGFTISATDNLSGIKAIYMKSPNSNSFVSVGTESKTVSKGSVSGLYTFYAEDKAGNKTEYRYVNFDSTSPEIKCIGAEFGTSSSSGFKVTATDDSGTVTLYRKMDDGNWIACGDSYTVNENADDGKYYFYAVDGYNNQTAEVWILLGGELYGEFVKSNTDNSVYFTWGRSSWTATLDGISYVKETWIMDEGNHTMKLSSNGNSAVYNFSIEHNYIAKSTTATCTQGGSTVYECNQCGNEYIAYSTEETGHYYVASTVAATCTDGGFTVYTCTRCGDNYIDNETRKLGHSYTPRVIMATCTDGGHTQYTCSRCGDGYRSGITQALGHSYVTSTHAATCGLNWEDIDLEKERISVKRSYSESPRHGVVLKEPKTKKSKRTLTIPDILVKALSEYKKWYDEQRELWGDRWVESGSVFIQKDGKRVHPANIKMWVSKTCKLAGIDHFSVHSLRHTNITLQLMAGVPVVTVSGRAGHSRTSTTTDTYAYYIQSSDRSAAQTINSIFSTAGVN